MSKYTVVRDAISTAILAADTTCPSENVHKYQRFPMDTTKDQLYKLFGKVSSTNQNQGESNDSIHAWIFTRSAAPARDNVFQAFGGSDEARELQEEWRLDIWKTLIDPSNAEGTEEPTEYAFQELLDAVCDEIIQNAGIQSLAYNNRYVVGNVSIPTISTGLLAGELHCHFATISITFNYPRYVAT